MSFNVRLFGYSGIIQVGQSHAQQYSGDAVFLNEEPCLWSQILVCDGSTVATSARITTVPDGTQMVCVEVPDGHEIRYEVVQPGAAARVVSSDSRRGSGSFNLAWSPGFRLSIIDAVVVSAAPIIPALRDVSPAAGFWFDIAMSSDGTKVAAVDDDSPAPGGRGSLWTSADSGASWTERTGAGTHSWLSVAMSSDGSIIAGCWTDNPGPTQGATCSTDGGATWNTYLFTGAEFTHYIAMSGDGTKIVVADQSFGGGNGKIWISTDFGVSFAVSAGAGTHEWYAVDISRDGTTIAAASINGFLMVSTNAGASWIDRKPSFGAWTAVAVSSDGSKIAASKGVGVYYSTNSGVSFSALASTAAFFVNIIEMSDDGATMLVGADASDNLMLSTDSGSTWTEQHPPSTASPWYGLALSADGSVGAVADGDNDKLWVGIL